MPLSKLKTHKDGSQVFTTTPSGEVIEVWDTITLEGEMSVRNDFMIGAWDYLEATFDENVHYTDGMDKPEKFADFLRAHIKGPYYLCEEEVNTRVVYS